jgi:hypothetical protein
MQWVKKTLKGIGLLTLSTLPLSIVQAKTVQAQTNQAQSSPLQGKGIHFYHQDWEVACDNTRTCRAAGYQADDGNSFPVSVLLTRKAGSRQAVSAQVKLGTTDYVENQPAPQSVQLVINQINYGKVSLNRDALSGNLSSAQTQALIAALAGHTVIEFKSGQDRWNLSGQGAAAVLLKMDDVQGRVGTTGALLRKGKKNEAKVLPALPMPVVNWVKPAVPSAALKRLVKSVDLVQLKKEILTQTPKTDDNYCPVINDEDAYVIGDNESVLEVQPLNHQKLLASGLCWRGAYNTGYGFWLINSQKPYQPKLVMTGASDYSDGVINAVQKGRGLGDCWSHEQWTWNGRQFIQTDESTTGMCRMVELGGAWSLPTQVATVKKASVKEANGENGR